MMHYLEIPRARDTDIGQVRVVARNIEGEAEASTSLNVLPHDDWRSKLRQAPKGMSWRKCPGHFTFTRSSFFTLLESQA